MSKIDESTNKKSSANLSAASLALTKALGEWQQARPKAPEANAKSAKSQDSGGHQAVPPPQGLILRLKQQLEALS